ncbi:MAG: sigma-70 family RNA polymerase sigma factor [Peptococcaceae bacterium]|nr:sigma-70 family RNA polymerase sigma factor [Peptococcaceae bacterium]
MDGEQRKSDDFREIAESLYKENYKHVYKVVFFAVHEKSSADDLVQEAFYKAFKNIDQLSDGKKFKAWVTAIAINLCRNHMKVRKNKELPLEHLGEHTPDESAEKQFMQNLVRSEIEGIFKELNYEEKEIILLKYHFGFTSKEIAEYYKISMENVNVKLFRAKNKFKEKHQRQSGKGA